MENFTKIGVVGAGSWGTALAVLLAEWRTSVKLWGHSAEVVHELINDRVNTTYLPGVRLQPNIYATSKLDEVMDSDIIFLVPPSKVFRSICQQLAGLGPSADSIWVSCTKGIEHDSGKLMSEIIEEELPHRAIAVLSGPNHAVEIAQRIPAAGVIGCLDAEIRQQLLNGFSKTAFRAYGSEDLRGIQLGGALKNVFAIAAGCSDGFNMGDNAKAALVTRSLAEMMRLGVALGGKAETFYGLSGIGDLMVTCFSPHSRNRKVGERLGRGETPEAIQASMKMIAEGIPTALSARQCAQKLGIEAPIIEQVYQALYEKKAPHLAMWELLGRAPKQEGGC